MSDLVDRIAGLSPAKRALLELMAARRQGPGTAGIPRRADPNQAPLSFAQERVWFLEQLEPGTMVYHLPLALRVAGLFDPSWIARGLAVLTARHEALRTTIGEEGGRPLQRVAPEVPLPIEVVDLAELAPDRRDQALARISRLVFERPFDLCHGPLWRMTVVRERPDSHVVLLAMHHLIGDGWSLELFAEEMFACCAAYAAGEEPVLPPVPLQFGDYAAWQRAASELPGLADQLAYWTRQLDGLPVLELPTDLSRPPVPSYRGRTLTFTIGEARTRAVHDVSRRHGVTPFMTLLAAYVVLLSRYSGQRDLAIGSPVANRQRTETERLIGFFANTLVFRVDVSDNPTFARLLARVRDVVLSAHDRQDVPFEQLVDALQPRRDPSRNPLFQVMLALQKPSRLAAHPEAAVAASLLPVEASTAKFDLTLTLQERQGDYAGTLEYSTDVFADDTAARIVDHFTTILDSALGDPLARVESVSLLGADERRRVLIEWNRTATDWPSLAPLPALVEAQVARTPEATALVGEDTRLTYADLNLRANQLAHYLRARGVGPEVVVGVCLQRSVDLVVALLAIVKAGAAYLPLDPTYPPDRLEFMLADARALVVIGERQSPVGAAVAGAAAFVDPAEVGADLRDAPTSNPDVAIDLDDAAYVIYTSGSTGTPKGVISTHRGIANRLLWMQAAYAIDVNDRVVQKTPFTFDVSVWEFFWPLMTGAALVVARPDGHRDPRYLADLIVEQAVTTVHFVPSMLELFLEEPASIGCRGLKRIICSGEALGRGLQARCRARLPAALHNLYGPTEASVDVTAWACEQTGTRSVVPIGHPIANTRMYIVDDRFEPVPIGVPGELLIAGDGLARGYLNRPEITAERFVPDPFAVEAGARVYRTGDVARFSADGAIEFIGRRDHQIKLRGFRVELGEIEAALQRCEDVQRAAVVLREGPADMPALVAYVVPAPAAAIEPERLRDALRRSLPDYMVPSAFVALDALPLTTSGKLDRARLPAPAAHVSKVAEAPRDEVEARLMAIWRDALGCSTIGVDDHFFELGGHSMLAVRVLASVREALGVSVPVRALFEEPTIAALAAVVRRLQAGDGPLPVTSSMNLEQHVRLAPDIWPPSSRMEHTGAGPLLLTGATGFLGAFLLRELLDRTAADVVCLARGASQDAALGRVMRALETQGLRRAGDERRVSAVCGDLAEPRLGLTESAFDTLASTIGAIYHNGALVNFLQPYQALAPANVGGTEEVLRLACRHVLKPVHMVSTIDVLGRASLTVSEDTPLGGSEGLETGYAQTKWVAERLAMLARDRGVPLALYRPARIIGDSRTGAWNTDDFAARVIKGCLQAGLAPADPPWDNLSPVEFVSAAIVELSLHPSALTTPAFHVVNPRWFLWGRMIDFARQRGYRLEVVSYAEWYAALTGTVAVPDNALAPLLALFPAPAGVSDDETPVAAGEPSPPPGPECHRAQAILVERGITCPTVDDALLGRYFDYFVRSGFLEPPPIRQAHEIALSS
ncbi:MAG: amino acid adenylation domain-containing protein [Acidobacteriota bacterium]